MRITNNMLINNVTYNLGNNLERMSIYQQQMATGKRINKPSDDPIASTRILKFRSDLSSLESYQSNAEDARSWMDMTESSVDDSVQAVQRIRELMVQGSNGVLSLGEKEKIAAEIEEIRNHIITDGNTNYAGRYIFSNFSTDKQLFNSDGSYNVPITQSMIDNPKPMLYEIAVGEVMDVNTSPLDVFGYVQEVNSMLETIPDGTNIGPTSATKFGVSNLNTDFSGGGTGDSTIDFSVDGTVFTIQSADLIALDGLSLPHDPADIINLINNAVDGGGDLFSSVADVTFDMDGVAAVKTGTFDLTTDFTGGETGDASVDIYVDGIDFKIAIADLIELNGSETPLEQKDIIELIENAGATPRLSEVADVTFDENGDLLITSLQENSSSSIEIVYNGDTGAMDQFDPLEPMSEAYLEQAFGLSPSVWTFELNADFSSGGADDSTVDINVDGTVFTIQAADLIALDGLNLPHDPADIINLINNADDGVNPLSSVADVTFDDRGKLVIKSLLTGKASSVEVTYNGDSLAADQTDPLEAMSSAFIEKTFGLQSIESKTAEDSTGYDIPNISITSKLTGSSSTLEVTYNGDSSIGLPTDPLQSDPLQIMSSAFLEQAFGLTEGSPTLLEGSQGYYETGTVATKAVKSGVFDLTKDLSGGGNDDATIDILIDGTTFTMLSTDISVMTASGGNPHEKADILNLINNAEDVTGNKLSTVADVYFDINSNLIVKSKSFGSASSVEVVYNGDTSVGVQTDPLEIMSEAYLEGVFGLNTAAPIPVDGTEGIDKIDAVVMDLHKSITDADVLENAQEYLDNTFLVTLNGETKEIEINQSTVLTSVNDLETALNTAMTKAFPGPGVVVSAEENPALSGEYYLSFSTANQVNDGNKVELKIENIVATESKLLTDINNAIEALRADEPPEVLTKFIGLIDDDLNHILTSEANIGARVNRIELITNRIAENNLTYTALLSDAQDVDMAEAIMLFQNAQNVYKASLSTGAQAIQPTLIDFIR